MPTGINTQAFMAGFGIAELMLITLFVFLIVVTTLRKLLSIGGW